MATTDLDTEGDVEELVEATSEAEPQPEAEPQLELNVQVDSPSACERHVVITVGRSEVERYFRKAFDEVVPKAELPGFRQGKAPRKLIESRFKDQVTEQVKSSLVMDSLQKVTDGGHFSAISEPDFDYSAVELPQEGDFRYEFRIEVRPDFDTPKWQGLKLTRPVCELSDSEVDKHLARTLTRFMPGEAVDGEAKEGDVVLFNASFSIAGKNISELAEETAFVRKNLSFGDAVVDGFDALMIGVREGERRTTSTTISNSAANEKYRGQKVDVEFEIIEVRRIEIDEISNKKLDELGFSGVDELRTFVRSELERQFEYHQQQALRKQIVDILTRNAKWDMPESLVRRQTNRELQRMVLELQRSGFNQEQIRHYVNVSRNNARESTINALREHFVLEKIADDLKIEPTNEEYDREIELIAEQNDLSPRRIRARLEKSGQMDAIRNQIIERHVINQIAQSANLTDVLDQSFLKKDPESSSIDFLITGEVAEIPEAKHDNDPTALPGAPKLPDNEKE